MRVRAALLAITLLGVVVLPVQIRGARQSTLGTAISSSGTANSFARLADLLSQGRSGEPATVDLASQLAGPTGVSIHDSGARARALHLLGAVHVERGEFLASLAPFREALDLRRKAGPDGVDSVAETLEERSRALIGLERFAEAESDLSAALAIRGDVASAQRGRTLELLAYLHRQAGRFPQARRYLDEALTLRQTFSPNQVASAFALELDGDLHWLTGDQAGAKAAWLRTLDLLHRTVGDSHPGNERPLRWLALAANAEGNPTEARSILARAQRIGRESLAPCHVEQVALADDAAMLAYTQGAFSESEELFRSAKALQARCLPPRHDFVATSLFNEGLLAADMGDVVRAEDLLTRATRMWASQLGASHPFTARGLDALAQVLVDYGQEARAAVFYRRALAIRRKSLGADHPDVAATLVNLAGIAARGGALTQALTQLDDASAMVARLGTSDFPDLPARVALIRGGVMMRLGRFAEAASAYTAALDLRSAHDGPGHPSAASARLDLARATRALGSQSSAMEGALRAEGDGQHHWQATARYLPERIALLYSLHRPRGLDLAMSLLADDPTRDPGPVYESWIRSRGSLLDEMAARAAASEPVSGGDGQEVTALRRARERFATLLWRSADGDASISREQIEQAQTAKEQAERGVAARAAEGRDVAPPTSIEALTSALPPNTALVSYARFDRTRANAASQSSAVPSYVAFIARAGSARIDVVLLGPASPIERAVLAWRREVSGPPGTNAGIQATGVQLRRLMWDPIGRHLTGAASVFVVADGLLNVVNVAALPASAGGYLVEYGPTLHYLSTERDVTLPSPKAAATGLLAVGGATFGGFGGADRVESAETSAQSFRSGCAAGRGLRFAPLPASDAEVRELAGFWPSTGLGEAVVLRGRAASEAAVKRAMTGRRVVHLATHGFVMGQGCSSAPLARSVGGLAASPAVTRARLDSPLLLSGLALAGANVRSRSGTDDGILTAEEIAGLDLQGTEWAVLSACDTGLGEIRAGEGVFGLRRAFQIAGARTVIMSLWSVDDQATRQWMNALYKGRLQDHLSTADAVRNASLTVLRDRRAKGLSTSPFYWAAFVAAGDWR